MNHLYHSPNLSIIRIFFSERLKSLSKPVFFLCGLTQVESSAAVCFSERQTDRIDQNTNSQPGFSEAGNSARYMCPYT